ncbi:MAG TPA: BlaI/MecI/CopY family transcriptional regulator [Streptosporangiaceae bacterium]|nr:BlaI/MecI/CopY family transcriptional regulator [Streptosporangiaceae bacterium]
MRVLREFGDLEMAIMEVMWAGDGPYVVREVRERLRYGRPVAYTTVMTVMSILHRKGVLNRDKPGRAFRYWPAEAREDHDARLMAEVLRSGGDQDVTMRRFLERVDDDEMLGLCSALADARSRAAGRAAGVPPAGSAARSGIGPDPDTISHLAGSPQVQAPAPLASSGVRHTAFLPGPRSPWSHGTSTSDDR